MSRLDYYNALLFGAPAASFNTRQQVLDDLAAFLKIEKRENF